MNRKVFKLQHHRIIMVYNKSKGRESLGRFINYILDDPDTFVPYIIKENPRMKDFGDLENAFKEAFPIQDPHTTSDELQDLFKLPQIQEVIKSNTTEEEYEIISGRKQIRIPKQKTEMVTIQIKEVHQKQRNGKVYARKVNVSRGYFYTPVQNKFISVRRKNGLSYKQITSEYNQSFPKNQRTESGIRTHSYRM